ncbi:MAG TPA: cyclopropane-fatty-acyl-phospholipid synthase family protein [Anaeromyxobacteraceae bacterium]|nr:cyclopropane-fatty-acyl-phospholipid synthase family protein [Anaeromyxobacteraceae bacterium]
MTLGIELAERGFVPTPVIRMGIRRLLRSRIREEAVRHSDREAALARFVASMEGADVAPVPALANRQHYEVPAAFFRAVLGSRMKYSSGIWPAGVDTLDASEEAMLRLTSERAEIQDGHRILDLGCGWGSFSLWAAEHFPASQVVGVSNSASQREFILGEARRRGLSNVEILTADMNRFQAPGRFDRVVSVEMFEHMRNWPELFRRIDSWLNPGGKLFIHVFASTRFAYLFETDADDDWMGRHFFTGGMMPSHDLLPRVAGPLSLEDHWVVPGTHYARTSEAWHENLLRNAAAAEASLTGPLSAAEARVQVRRWQMFFLACAELFGFDGGREWHVSHYRLAKAGGSR